MERKRVLILSVSGIGNTIMQSPLINELLARDDFIVDVFFGSWEMCCVFGDDERINRRYVLPKSFFGKLRFIFGLRRNRYDYSVSCFPSNRIEFNLFPFLVGARRRIIHGYDVGKLRVLSFLSNVRVRANKFLHDVEQNLNLLKCFGMKVPSKPRFVFKIGEENEKFAEKFVSGLSGRRIFGIHSGCGFLFEKKWPIERFVGLVKKLASKFDIVVFGQKSEVEPFLKMGGVSVCVGNLNDVAAVIKRCDRFLSADTGLMHIASVFGVRQYVLWGPTCYSRTRPWSDNAVFLGRCNLNLFRYPFEDTCSVFRCKDAGRYMREIDVEQVFRKVEEDE